MENSDTQKLKLLSNSGTSGVYHSGIEENCTGSSSVNNLGSQKNSFAVLSSELVIEVGPTTHTSGSSAVATKNITKYPWEQVYIPGNLVAVHCSDNFIAYAIKAPKTQNGMVRIVCRTTGVRGLIKNIPGLIKDISFAYLTSKIILGFTDHFGTLFVYEVHEELESLRTELVLEVKRRETEEASEYQRLIWCPFIPDPPSEVDDQVECDEENFAYLLVATNGPVAEIWHVATVIREHGPGLIDSLQVKPGPGRHYVMEQHSEPIVDAAFSPDGTALATAALDGYVKFFQVYITDDQSTPRCLHQWNPHDGKPLSCLFFLDNHKNPGPDVQFWKYAVTGACNNSEIKVWSCETWQSNQTITFECTDKLSLASPTLALKAAIDPTSKYLILSDLYRRVLFVLILCQEPLHSGTNSITNGTTAEGSGHCQNLGKGGMAKVISVTELPIQYPAISLTITSAEWKPYKRWKHEQLMQDNVLDCYDDDDDDTESIDIVEGLVFKCVLINTLSLQEAVIRFQPALPDTSDVAQYVGTSVSHNISSSQDSVILRDGLTDLSLSSIIAEMEPATSKQELRNSSVDSQNGAFVSLSSQTITEAISSEVSSAETVAASSATRTLSGMTVTSGEPVTPLNLEMASPLQSSSLSLHVNKGSDQPATMNLLTPESFSSPSRVEDGERGKFEANIKDGEIFPRRTPTPSEDLTSAALSLLLRVKQNSLPRHEASDTSSGPEASKASEILPNILDNVVAGSSRSPPVTSLPPPPRTRPSPLPDEEDAPLATSETSPTVGIAVPSSGSSVDIFCSKSISSAASTVTQGGSAAGFASSTSSPSLEVQQILHSHNNNKIGEDYEDELGGDEMELSLGNSDGRYSNKVQNQQEHSDILLDLPQPPSSTLFSLQTSIPNPHEVTSSATLLSTSSSTHSIPPPSAALPFPMVSKSHPIPLSSAPLPHPPNLQVERNSPSQPVVQNLINISSRPGSGFTNQMEPQRSSSHSPLIDMFTGLKSFPNASHASAAVNHENIIDSTPVSMMQVDHMQNASPFALPSASYVTCELLESEMSRGPSAKVNSSYPNFPPPKESDSPLCSITNFFNIDSENGISSDIQVEDISYKKTQEDIASLRQLILSCDSEQEERTQAVMDQTRALTSQVDKSLKQLQLLSKNIEDIRKSQTKLQEQFPHIISTTTRPIIENAIRQEIKSALTPALNKFLDPVRSQLTSETRNLVASSETHITEALSKTISSKSYIDTMNLSMANTMSAGVQNACRESYNKIVLPGFNAVTQQIFSQLNEAFTRGTKEYLQHVENETQQLKTTCLESISKSTKQLESSATTLSSQTNTLTETLHKSVTQQTSLSESLGDRLRVLVHDETARALQEHHAAIEARTSRAQTPAPTAAHIPTNPKVAQQQIQQLISQGQFNFAFKQALSVSDLSLVVFVCERINPQQLFSQTPCPLSQDVLLSLVNQLSHDLSTFTDLKTKYLEESVVNLDTSHPITREHMISVLQGLQRSLNNHLALHPNHKKLKMLLLAVNHLVGA